MKSALKTGLVVLNISNLSSNQGVPPVVRFMPCPMTNNRQHPSPLLGLIETPNSAKTDLGEYRGS